MKLEELASEDPNIRLILSILVVGLPSYEKDVADGLPFFSSDELTQIEEKYKKTGLTFQEIKRLATSKGMILKPATFKKYLGIGVIPGTFKIERIGKANIGYYPSRTVRDINLVKYSLFANLGFDDLLKSSVDAYSTNLFSLIEMRNPQKLWPLIDWEAIGRVSQIVEKESGQLLADGEISAAEMEHVKKKAAAYDDAAGNFSRAEHELQAYMGGLKIGGFCLLKKIFEEKHSSHTEKNPHSDDPKTSNS